MLGSKRAEFGVQDGSWPQGSTVASLQRPFFLFIFIEVRVVNCWRLFVFDLAGLLKATPSFLGFLRLLLHSQHQNQPPTSKSLNLQATYPAAWLSPQPGRSVMKTTLHSEATKVLGLAKSFPPLAGLFHSQHHQCQLLLRSLGRLRGYLPGGARLVPFSAPWLRGKAVTISKRRR